MDKAFVFAVLGLALVMFVTGWWRYDLVALVSLLILVVADIIPFSEAYAGFSHPVVVTVAAVLVLSRTLHNSGAVDIIAKWMAQVGTRLVVQFAAVTGLISLLSAFMNNVGAVALLMPVSIRMARRGGHPNSTFLMPLAFASLLGGMITLIGTPPNIIIATFWESSGSEPFRMFDFAPVGLAVTVVGVAFVSLVGWRLIPIRQAQSSLGDSFHIEGYMTEVGVPAESPFVGKLLRTIEEVGKEDVRIVGLIRRGRRYDARPATSLSTPMTLLSSRPTQMISKPSSTIRNSGWGARGTCKPTFRS
jgi:di/tricarboxylate transporter